MFNTALGYFMAGLAEQASIPVIEMSFDENGLLLKTAQDVDPGAMYEAFSADNHMDVIERYIIGTQIFAKRFRKLPDAASSSPSELVRRKSARNSSNSARMPSSTGTEPWRVHPHP